MKRLGRRIKSSSSLRRPPRCRLEAGARTAPRRLRDGEAEADAGLGDDVPRPPGAARSSCAGGSRARAGSACPRPTPGPQTCSRIIFCVTTRSAFRARKARMSNSVGVSATSSPASVTRRRATSIARSPAVDDRRRRGRAPPPVAAAPGCGPAARRPRMAWSGSRRRPVQGRDLVGLGRAHRQDEDRRRHPRAQLAADLDAAHVRQREVEDDQVGRLVDGLRAPLRRSPPAPAM